MARIKIDFDGFDEMLKQFEQMEKDLKPAVEKALEASFDVVTPGIKSVIPSHRVSGATEESLIKTPQVEWSGNVGEVKVGFDLGDEIASQFLIYGAKASATGVPYRAPDMRLWNAVHGSAVTKKVAEVQKEVFERELMKRNKS